MQLTAPQAPPVEIQLIRRQAEDDVLTFKQTPVSLRYDRLPQSVHLLVPTAESFVAMSTRRSAIVRNLAICSILHI